MKKIGNRGFTLVELLVVLVILVVIMVIAVPSITSSVERSKQKQKNSKIELILSSMELYVDRNRNTCASGCTRTVKNLVCNDKLLTKEQAKDPFNDKYTLGGYVIYSNGNYSWVEVANNDSYRVNINTVC